MGSSVRRDENEAVGTERGKYGTEAAALDQRPGCGDDILLRGDWHAGRLAELAPVRTQEIGAAIADMVAPPRVDDDLRPGLLRSADDLQRDAFGQHPLRIIRNDDHPMARHQLAREAQQILADVRSERDRALAIGAQ